MKPDSGCSTRLEPNEAWTALREGRLVQWCDLCKRFRLGICERIEEMRYDSYTRGQETKRRNGKT